MFIDDLGELQRGDQGRIWLALQREIELYEHTEFTGYSDSWLRTFMAYANAAGLVVKPDNFVTLLHNVFLQIPAYHKYRRDVRFDPDIQYLQAVRFPVHMRYVIKC